MITAKKGPSQMTKEEYREYNRLVQQRYRKRQKDTIAKLRAENERLRAELKAMKGGVGA